MAIPKPETKEDQDEYVDRCVMFLKKEGKIRRREQMVARCRAEWRKKMARAHVAWRKATEESNVEKNRMEGTMKIIDKIDKFLLERGDTEYQEFFRKKMKEWGINDPGDLSPADRKKFFNEVDREFKAKSEGVEVKKS